MMNCDELMSCAEEMLEHIEREAMPDPGDYNRWCDIVRGRLNPLMPALGADPMEIPQWLRRADV